MTKLVQAEWMKLSRRPLSWVLLIIFLIQVALFISVLFLGVALNDGVFPVQVDFAQALGAEHIEQIRLRLSFPGIFAELLGQVNGTGGIMAVILAASAMGSEYTWGTLRMQLSRQPDRRRYLIAKLIALLLIVMTGIGITLIVGMLLSLLYGSVLGNVGSVSMRDVVLVPVGIVRATYIMLPYMLFGVAMSILGRSVVTGIVGGILLIVVDSSTGTPALLAAIDSPLVLFIYNLLLQQNVNTLLFVNFDLYGIDANTTLNLIAERLPSPLQAVLVIGFYSIVFFGYAYFLLTRRDVPGAG